MELETIWIEEGDGEGYHLNHSLMDVMRGALASAFVAGGGKPGDTFEALSRMGIDRLVAAFPPPNLRARRAGTVGGERRQTMNETYAADIAMYELSRWKPRQHLIDEIAERVIKAGKVGAVILDAGLTDEDQVNLLLDAYLEKGTVGGNGDT